MTRRPFGFRSTGDSHDGHLSERTIGQACPGAPENAEGIAEGRIVGGVIPLRHAPGRICVCSR